MHSKITRNFRYARFSKKVGFFEENTLGGRPKMKELLKNSESTWSGFFFKPEIREITVGKWGGSGAIFPLQFGGIWSHFPIGISRISG